MQREYGLDLTAPGILDGISWRKLQTLVAGLSADSVTMLTLRRRREMGDFDGVTEVIETPEQVDAWLRRRFGDQAMRSGPH